MAHPEPYQGSRLELLSEMGEVAVLHRWVDRLPSSYPLMNERLSDIRLVLEEAVVNAIRHGNALDGSKTVRVSVADWEDGWEFAVCDDGPGVDFAGVANPLDKSRLTEEGGRGLLFVRALADEVHFCKDVHGLRIYFHSSRKV
jgi:serine/threonine-protein kinase RsbW